MLCSCDAARPLLPSQTRPFMRANPREQAVSAGETRGLAHFKIAALTCSLIGLTAGCISECKMLSLTESHVSCLFLSPMAV